jgi:hypothetical protein
LQSLLNARNVRNSTSPPNLRNKRRIKKMTIQKKRRRKRKRRRRRKTNINKIKKL